MLNNVCVVTPLLQRRELPRIPEVGDERLGWTDLQLWTFNASGQAAAELVLQR